MKARARPRNRAPLRAALALLLLLSGGATASAVPGPDLPLTTLPGAEAPSPQLAQQLRERWQGRAADYKPRTRHLNQDGTPQYTNRLFLSSSPYLLQHAHNPVNWYPWSEEAFEAAKQLGRAVFLSVGYSTCHWCHVMEEESFEDEEIAAYLNANYIAIKVDREERPDIDGVYMRAVQAQTGSGGWPMNVWLTAERKPFYGGTYFPPRDGGASGRPGLLSVLTKINQLYHSQPDKIAASSASLSNEIQRRLVGGADEAQPLRAAVLQVGYRQASASFDADNGGTRGAPKFPSGLPLRFLLRFQRRTGEERALMMVNQTLTKMGDGGIYDHLGGGFHRYSTDARWLVPHFEKMLYDNALLAITYLEAYQATGRDEHAARARDVLRYLAREMRSPNGAFYAATDADSLAPDGRREEGRFFTWSASEIDAELGAEHGAAVRRYFGVTAGGNFEGRSILHVADPSASPPKSWQRDRERLYQARARRPPPLRDDNKIIAAWNGLAISAFARAAFVFNEEGYAAIAARAADFVLNEMRRGDRLARAYKDGEIGAADGFLDDYAFLIAGLIDLYEATNQLHWLDSAVDLDGVLGSDYEDVARGGFFLSGKQQEQLLTRDKPSYDGAEPSGNSVQALNLLRLHELTGDPAYRTRADRMLAAYAPLLEKAPQSLGEMLLAADFALDRPKEIVIVTSGKLADAEPLIARLRRAFVPNKVTIIIRDAEVARQRGRVPLLAGKTAANGKATAYVCEDRTCALPTSDPDLFERQINKKPKTND